MGKRPGRRVSQFGIDRGGPGKYYDMGGLMLDVREGGGASWVFRYTAPLGGRQRDMGLGPARGLGAISWAEARSAVTALHQKLRAGIDPIEEAKAKKAAAREAPKSAHTFDFAAMEFIKERSKSRAPATVRHWKHLLRKHVSPMIGSMALDAIGKGDVTTLLHKMDHIPSMASDVRIFIESVLMYANYRECKRSGGDTWRRVPSL